MIAEAVVDAYGESEQIVGFYTMLEDNLAVPFDTEILGVEVTVERIDMTDYEQIVAVCTRGKSRQRVPILDLPSGGSGEKRLACKPSLPESLVAFSGFSWGRW